MSISDWSGALSLGRRKSIAAIIGRSMSGDSPYNYVPSRTVAIIMLALFGVSTVIHAGQAVRYRQWWLLATACFCGIIEIMGWSGRLWSSFSPLLDTPFQIEITCTIVAPTPFLAANFVILGHIISRLGSQYSRIGPNLYTIIFCTCDVVSLVIQGVGGAMAAMASDLEKANHGANVMLGGIAFQLAIIILSSIFALEYFIRYTLDAPLLNIRRTARDERGTFTFNLKMLTYALCFSTALLFTRAVYRTVELSDGWNGRIISNQLYFNVLDATMVVLAMYSMNIINPGHFLREQSVDGEPKA